MAIIYIRNHLWFLLLVSFCGFMYLKQRMSCLDKKVSVLDNEIGFNTKVGPG